MGRGALLANVASSARAEAKGPVRARVAQTLGWAYWPGRLER